MADEDEEELKRSVRGALAGRLRSGGGSSESSASQRADSDYHAVVRQLRSSGSGEPEQQRRLYAACAQCVASVAQQPDRFSELLGVIFNGHDWKETEIAPCEAYAELLSRLVSSNNNCMHGAVSTLVRSMVRTVQGSELSDPLLDTDGEAKRKIMHDSIEALVRAVPTGAHVLVTELTKHFGIALSNHSGQSKKQVALLHHIITAMQRVPTLQLPMVTFLVRKLVEIDVEIKIDPAADADVDDDDVEEALGGVGAVLDIDDILAQDEAAARSSGGGAYAAGVADGALAEDGGHDESERDTPADMLDRMMRALFDYVESEMTESEEACSRLFDVLLTVFEDVVLRTHRCKFVQFLMFYACQFDQMFPPRFCDLLLQKLLSEKEAVVVRQACVAYLASFMSRAQYIQASQVERVLATLLNWAHRFLDRATATASASLGKIAAPDSNVGEETSSTGVAVVTAAPGASAAATPQAEKLTLFYAVCQGMFYISCFKGTAFSAPADGDATRGAHPHLRDPLLCWNRIVACRFEPLCHCLEAVAREFLFVAEWNQLVRQSVILQPALARLRSDESTASADAKASRRRGTRRRRRHRGVGGLGHGKNPLESFFPFDPYLLRRSYAYIGEIYSEWSGREDRERSDDDGDVDSSEQNGSESEDTPESPSSASLLQMPVRRRTMSMGAQSDEVDDNFHELQPVTDEPARKRFRHGSLGSEFDEADSGW